MKKKTTRHQMYVKPQSKHNTMKMKDNMDDMCDMDEEMDDMCDMDDMDDMCDMDDMDDMCDMDDMDDMCDMPQDCGKEMKMDMCDKMPECMMLAHAYVPWQCYERAFTPPEALMKGTLFPELWGVYRIPR